MPPTTDFMRARNKIIIEQARTGKTYQEIANDFHVSRGRVHQIVKAAGLVKRVDFTTPLENQTS